VKDRISVVDQTAATLKVQGAPPPGLADEMRAAQDRLALLMRMRRTSLPSEAPRADPARSEPLLAEADRRAAAGDREGALAVLASMGGEEPNDPRLSYRRGELLYEAGRYDEAILAWRRTLALDPSRAQVLYRMGLACKQQGDRQRAVSYLEQAARRFGAKSEMQEKAQWEVEKLTFPVIAAAGLSDGDDAEVADTVAGFSRESFAMRDGRAFWWGRLQAHYLEKRHTEKLRVRWIAPGGDVALDQSVTRAKSPYVTAELDFAKAKVSPGVWRLEAVFEGDVVDRRTLTIAP
jgi:tetratricopeptide (TPR) repeat protein